MSFRVSHLAQRANLFFFCLSCLSLAGCTETVQVREQMTWQLAPEEYHKRYYAKPEEYVRFRFVKNPHCFEVESARNLGLDLVSAGRPVVNVDFDVWGHPHQVHGWRMVAVDGRPIRNVGGWGSAGKDGDIGRPCPMEADALAQ